MIQFLKTKRVYVLQQDDSESRKRERIYNKLQPFFPPDGFLVGPALLGLDFLTSRTNAMKASSTFNLCLAEVSKDGIPNCLANCFPSSALMTLSDSKSH